MQDRDEARRIDAAFVAQKHAHLRVAILFDQEHLIVRGDEVTDLVREGEGADAQRVEVEAFGLERWSGDGWPKKIRFIVMKA